MTNYVTMQTRIADELVRDDISSQIQNAIQTAIKTWEGARFYFNEKRYLLSTVASQEYYNWTSMTNTMGSELGTGERLLEVDNARIEYNSQWYDLIPRTMSWIEGMQVPAATYTSEPYDYTIYGDQIRLSPIPDAVYTTTWYGLARLPTLSADSDTNAWMTEAEALIRNQAKLHLCLDVLADPEGAAEAEKAVAIALPRLTRISDGQRGLGLVRPWC